MIIRFISVILLLITSFSASAVERDWNRCVLDAINTFPHAGGYYTGRKVTAKFPHNAWEGMNNAFVMNKEDLYPSINVNAAQPSFCSLSTYMAILKALTLWDANHSAIGRDAWMNLKPYVGIDDTLSQCDGQGCWGRANANGPGMAVLVEELKAGKSNTAFRGAKSTKNKETSNEIYLSDEQWRNEPIWNEIMPGDIMKIFWDRNESKGSDSGAIVGCNPNDDDQEHGHSTIFMGYTQDGKVKYWSSNGPGKEPEKNGYGIGTCDKSDIQRIVITHITNPERFNNAKFISPNSINEWLHNLDGVRHATTDELKYHCNIK